MHTGRLRRSKSALRLDALEDRQVPAPVVLDPNLGIRPVVSGLAAPTGLAVLGSEELLVLEKNTGQVKHVVNGQVQETLIDLAVNNASERGLLGIALDPNFQRTRAVYLYWTQPADPAPGDGTFPSVREGPDEPALGVDTDDVLAVPLLGNRVDRFIWDGDSLEFDRNLIRLRVYQNDGVPTPAGQGDEGQPARGNHDDGVIRFGRDGKLYVIVGDLGRRGLAQKNRRGPVPDDQFGGTDPDDAHLSGLVRRLHTDGSARAKNPFFRFGQFATFLDPSSQNLQKARLRHPQQPGWPWTFTGNIWDTENGTTFDEVNLVRPAQLRLDQTMGPGPGGQFKKSKRPCSTRSCNNSAIRRRGSPTAQRSAGPMVDLLGRSTAIRSSAGFAVPPAALEFMDTKTLGGDYARDLIVGNLAGQLMDFALAGNRRGFRFDSDALRDLVDDNNAKFVPNESAPLVFAQDFGIITAIHRDPNGGLFVVSLTDGAVYEVFRKGQATRFEARATGAEEVPPVTSPGSALLNLRVVGNSRIKFDLSVEGLSNVTAAHLHLGVRGVDGPVIVTLFEAAPAGGPVSGRLARGEITAADLEGPLAGMTLTDLIVEIESGRVYLNVHTDDGVAPPDTGPGDFPGGEVRGQVTVLR